MTPRIAIDVTPYAYAPHSGTGVYVRSIVRELLALGVGAELHLISSKRCDLSWAVGASIWIGDGELSRHNIFWWITKGRRIVSRIGADCFWSVFQYLPLGGMGRTREVVSTLDLVWHRMPEMMEFRNWLFHRLMVPRSLRRADAVVAISKATADDLMKRLDVPREKIHVIPLAADPVFFPMMREEAGALIAAFPFSGREYVLAVGASEPRKNYLRLAQAVERLRAGAFPELNLVIAGSGGWKNTPFEIYATDSARQPWLHVVKGPTKELLRALYSRAGIFAFPSLLEGFGIPILEAMACGCPVVTSNCSSMPEVAGNVAMLVDPLSVDAIASGIAHGLMRRNELSQKGLERVKDFSWRHSAVRHMKVFMGERA